VSGLRNEKLVKSPVEPQLEAVQGVTPWNARGTVGRMEGAGEKHSTVAPAAVNRCWTAVV
jgi:hypothetical protein